MTNDSLLGDHQVDTFQFQDLDHLFKEFSTDQFQGKNEHTKRTLISKKLAALIRDAPEGAFLLPAISSFINRVHEEGVVNYYTFSSFEIWLNQFSDRSIDEKYRMRAKITGRFVPRDSYQLFFPVGMGKRYPGSHFVTAHSSPDLDTTVASFWGFVEKAGFCPK